MLVEDSTFDGRAGGDELEFEIGVLGFADVSGSGSESIGGGDDGCVVESGLGRAVEERFTNRKHEASIGAADCVGEHVLA